MKEVQVDFESSNQKTNTTADLNFEKLGKRLKLFTIAFYTFVVATLIIVIFLMKQKADVLETKIVSFEKRLTQQEENINNLKQFIKYSFIQHYMEGGVVTEDLVVEKIIFYPNDKPSIDVDVACQPLFEVHYKGKGQFDLSDRELKATVKDLISSLEKTYNDFKANYYDGLIDFNKYEITITIKNYEIGKYVNGDLKLKGE